MAFNLEDFSDEQIRGYVESLGGDVDKFLSDASGAGATSEQMAQIFNIGTGGQMTSQDVQSYVSANNPNYSFGEGGLIGATARDEKGGTQIPGPEVPETPSYTAGGQDYTAESLWGDYNPTRNDWNLQSFAGDMVGRSAEEIANIAGLVNPEHTAESVTAAIESGFPGYVWDEEGRLQLRDYRGDGWQDEGSYRRPQDITTQTVDMTDDMTVAGQVRGLIDENSPLMQQARTRGLQEAASRGLLNTSMATQAAQAALYDKAVEIGGQDAAAYLQNAEFNANALNNMAQFNSELASKFELAQMEIDSAMERLMVSEAGQNSRHLATIAANQVINDDNISFEDRSRFSEIYSNLTSNLSEALQSITTDPNMSPEDKAAFVEDMMANYTTDIGFYGSLWGVDLDMDSLGGTTENPS